MMDTTLKERAEFAGLPPSTIEKIHTLSGDEGVESCLAAVHRGLPVDVVKTLADLCPAALFLVVGIQADAQSLAPLGGWSAAVHDGRSSDAYGGERLLRVLADRVGPSLLQRYGKEKVRLLLAVVAGCE